MPVLHRLLHSRKSLLALFGKLRVVLLNLLTILVIDSLYNLIHFVKLLTTVLVIRIADERTHP